MEEMIPCSVKDQEVFQRVWQRVMAGRDDAQCPIGALPPNLQGDLSCECMEALARQRSEGFPDECQRQPHETVPGAQPSGWQNAEMTPAPESPEPTCPVPDEAMEQPMEQPAPEEPVEQPAPEEPPMEAPAQPDGLPEADGPHRDNDLPQLWEEPQEATDRTARLRRHVMDALEGWQFYRHLARRARGGDARVLNNLAGDLHRQARKLSAAYFLLTGLRYWPSELLSTPAIPSYWGALRARHQAEQRQETAFRIAQDDWAGESDLPELYAQLIEDSQNRCHQLRALLEQDVS